MSGAIAIVYPVVFRRNYANALLNGDAILRMLRALARFRDAWQDAGQPRRAVGISAAAFTGLTIREQEIGGSLTRDRLPEFPFKVIRQITIGH